MSTPSSCPARRAGAFAVLCLCAAALSSQEPAPVPKPAPEHENRLAAEPSPYLRQHRHNPVDWYPWGDEALARAKREDKPIFLSIGYSACHWCHVMAAESFEDPAIAALLNANFVCIKVDREERPDLDEIYMSAVQAMGQQGGWPLSVWLTPDGRPFYGGTYFPPEDGLGRPGFRRVNEALAKAWRERKDEVLAGAGELQQHLQQVLAPALAPGEPTPELLANVLVQSRERFDPQHGGFAQPPSFAPKFPHASELQALLRLDDPAALPIVTTTLHAMRKGGMHDQLGGGFHRYSTDRRWLVPHFEKMLYDNALLVPCYLDAFLATGEPAFAAVAQDTLDYALRELAAPGGGFWSSQDAQSEGVEGRYFVWQRREFDALLGDDAALAAAVFGVTAEGNWEHQNVLWLADEQALAEPAAHARIERARAVLLAARERRVKPGTDDKVLAAWNGLMLDALCAGHRVLGDPRYLDAARRTGDFVCRDLCDGGRVARSWQGGERRGAGYLEDHAAIAGGLLSLFEIDSDPRWLTAAVPVLDAIERHFRADDGSFWFTADDHEALLARSKSAIESSTPSGIALAALAFLRAGLLLGDERRYGLGVDALRANHALLRATPAAAPALVLALQFHLGGPREIVVAGEPDDPRTRALLAAAWRRFPAPGVVALVHDGNRARLAELSPVFAGKQAVAGAPMAYVCERGVCRAPTSDPAALAAVSGEAGGAPGDGGKR